MIDIILRNIRSCAAIRKEGEQKILLPEHKVYESKIYGAYVSGEGNPFAVPIDRNPPGNAGKRLAVGPIEKKMDRRKRKKVDARLASLIKIGPSNQKKKEERKAKMLLKKAKKAESKAS